MSATVTISVAMSREEWQVIEYIILGLPSDMIQSYTQTDDTLQLVCHPLKAPPLSRQPDGGARVTVFADVPPPTVTLALPVIRALMENDVLKGYRYFERSFELRCPRYSPG